MQPIIRLTRIDKPIGSWLLLWPCIVGVFSAASISEIQSISQIIKLVFIFGIGCVITRSLGCAINDLTDRKIDSQVTRTKSRPLADKTLSKSMAIIIILILSCCAISLTATLNTNSKIVCLIAGILLIIYPHCKYYFRLPQLVLGICYAIPIVVAASEFEVLRDIYIWLVFVSIILWVIHFDSQYAMQDKMEDIKLNLYSSTIFFGQYTMLICIFLLLIHVILCCCFILYNKNANSISIVTSILMITTTIPQILYQLYLYKYNFFQKTFLINNYWGMSIAIIFIINFFMSINLV